MANKYIIFIVKLVPIFLFLGAQLFLVMSFCPDVESGGDAISKWLLGKRLSMGELDQLDVYDHHHLRWGSWIPAFLANIVFSDEVSVYFLTTIIPTTIAGIVFISLISFTINPLMAVLFSFFWVVDPMMNRMTFQLLPTAHALLPLSLICLYLTYIDSRTHLKYYDIVVIAVLFFWLYGVKETNLFFVPGVILYLFCRFKGAKKIVLLIVPSLLLLYCLESIFFYYFFEANTIWGRIYFLLGDDGIHKTIMLSDEVIRSESEKHLMGGVLIRLFEDVEKHHSVIYFLSALLALLYLGQSSNKSTNYGREYQFYSYLLLSYLFLNIFFIIDFSPVTIGQPLRTRYLSIMLPLSFIITFVFIRSYLAHTSLPTALMGILLFIVYVSYPLELHYNRLGEKFANVEIFNDYSLWRESIFTYDNRYRTIANEIDKSDCIVYDKRKKYKFRIYMIPDTERGPRFEEFSRSDIHQDNNKFYLKNGDDCTTTLRFLSSFSYLDSDTHAFQGFVLYNKLKSDSKTYKIENDLLNIYYSLDDNILVYHSKYDEVLLNNFFLHVYPEHTKDLPDYRREFKFENFDFEWNIDDAGVGEYFRAIKLPSYKIKLIRTGQFNDEGRLWQVPIKIMP